jgi:hypothetical protein
MGVRRGSKRLAFSRNFAVAKWNTRQWLDKRRGRNPDGGGPGAASGAVAMAKWSARAVVADGRVGSARLTVPGGTVHMGRAQLTGFSNNQGFFTLLQTDQHL